MSNKHTHRGKQESKCDNNNENLLLISFCSDGEFTRVHRNISPEAQNRQVNTVA